MDAFNMTHAERRQLAERLLPAGDKVIATTAYNGNAYNVQAVTESGEHYTVRVSCITLQLCGERYVG